MNEQPKTEAQGLVIYIIYHLAKGLEAAAHQDMLMARVCFKHCLLAYYYLKSEVLNQPLTEEEERVLVGL